MAKGIGIWAAIVTGIVEEVVFRQLLMDWLMSIGFGTVVNFSSGNRWGVGLGKTIDFPGYTLSKESGRVSIRGAA